jgi:hypothetical protein
MVFILFYLFTAEPQRAQRRLTVLLSAKAPESKKRSEAFIFGADNAKQKLCAKDMDGSERFRSRYGFAGKTPPSFSTAASAPLR